MFLVGNERGPRSTNKHHMAKPRMNPLPLPPRARARARPPLRDEQVTDASFSLSGDVLATAAEDGTVRVWDTGAAALLDASAPFPESVACLRAFRAAPEGSALSRVLVVDADTALVTGDEENRLLKVLYHLRTQFTINARTGCAAEGVWASFPRGNRRFIGLEVVFVCIHFCMFFCTAVVFFVVGGSLEKE